MVCSYTTSAAAEAASRDTGLPMDHIGTLHSHAYQALGVARGSKPDLVDHGEFNEAHTGYRLSRSVHGGLILPAYEVCEENDHLVKSYQLRREKMEPRSGWPQSLLDFAEIYEAFKRKTESIDFTDMLELCLTEARWLTWEPRHIFIDEAQDMTRLQVALAKLWAGHPSCYELAMIGDPDQALYEHVGSFPQLFYEVPKEHRQVLTQSYRVPQVVRDLASLWRNQLPEQEEEFIYKARDDPGELAQGHASLSTPARIVELVAEELSRGGTVMLMATCAYMLNKAKRRGWTSIVRLLEEQRISFWNPWRKREAYWNPEREDGAPDPKLAIGTVHSFKGAEADTVILLPDLSPAGFRQLNSANPGPVIRQMYVALTRAKYRLVLCDASSPNRAALEDMAMALG